MLVSLTTAFKMRNEIKRAVVTRQSLLRGLKTSIEEDKKELASYQSTEGKDIDTLLKEILVAQENLAILNTKIDEANLPNRSICHQIDSVKANLATLAYLDAEAKRFSPKRIVKTTRKPTVEEIASVKNRGLSVYDLDLEEDKIENWVLLFDAKNCYQKITDLKKQKNFLESKLSLANAKTEVDLDDNFKQWYDSFVF